MNLTFCFIMCLAQFLSYVKANNGKYTIIAPGTIHSNEKYTAAVAVHHISQPCDIKVGITGPSYNQTKQVKVSQHEVKHAEFELPSLEKGDYNLTAEGVNCFENFKNTTKLIYNKFHNNVLIHTDKGLYKPGDDINYRILFMDKDLRPVKPQEDVLIWFEDGNRNIIMEITDVKTVQGVHTGKFKISEDPVTGAWRLGVKNGAGISQIVDFYVVIYVPPKYVVKMEYNNHVSAKDDMKVFVRANYNDGKPLVGKATVALSYLNSTTPDLITTNKLVNGKAEFSFYLRNFDIYSKDERLKIDNTVEEHFSGIKINKRDLIHVHLHRYLIHCRENCSRFEAGKEMNVTFNIMHANYTYPKDTSLTAKLIYKEKISRDTHNIPTVSGKRSYTFKGNLTENGLVTIRVLLPDLPVYKGFLHYYKWKLHFLDQTIVGVTFQNRKLKKTEIPRKVFNQTKDIFILKRKPRDHMIYVSKTEQFALESSQPLSYFIYNVIARGNILKSGHVDLPDKPNVYNLNLTPAFSWVPRVSIYVYYVDAKGGYHYAEQKYKIEEQLENQINITATKLAKPGEEVALTIQTTSNSFVGLTAVNKIAFYHHNKDIMFEWYGDILNRYGTSTPEQGGSGKYPGDIVGCVTLTNAEYFYNWTKPDSAKDKYSKPQTSKDTTADATYIPNKPAGATWIFANIENTEVSEFRWSKKIPETVTSWYVTAFSLSPTKGLGITTMNPPTTIKASTPLSVSVRLPPSVKRGEIINVPALVFNYMKNNLYVEVSLNNSDDVYEFVDFYNKTISEKIRSKSLLVPANDAATVSFLLKAKVIGNVVLKFTVVSPIVNDTIHKSMVVVPEGITNCIKHAYFVKLKNESEVKSSFKVELPKHIVPDSERVEVGIMGNILANIFNSLDGLRRLPRGCVEQTISTLLFNYLVMIHLKHSKRLTPIMEAKLRNNIEDAYQNMLKYRHADGSFSRFGHPHTKIKPHSESTWLTAYAVRSLLQIKEIVFINEKIISDGLNYLTKQQAENGTFIEKSTHFYASKKSHIVFTCAAILAILENGIYAHKYSKKLNKGLEFIAQNIDTSDSLYARALGTYTLNKAKHPIAKEKLSKMKSLAKTESDRMWWSSDKQQFGRSNDVEITSYVLLTLLDQEATKVDDVLPIIKWLIAENNGNSDFASTPNSAVGLTAFIKFVQFADYEPAKISVDVESNDKRETINLTEDNGILYQSVQMPRKTKSIQFNANGTGSALVKISYHYNTYEKSPAPSFTITTTRTDNRKRAAYYEMSVCVTYVGEGQSSTLALLEFNAPSGYVVDAKKFYEIKNFKTVGNTELKNSDSLLVVYFDYLHKNEKTCLTIKGWRTHLVAMQKPAAIVVYDYYDSDKKATAFYELGSKLCDICETEEECRKCK